MLIRSKDRKKLIFFEKVLDFSFEVCYNTKVLGGIAQLVRVYA